MSKINLNKKPFENCPRFDYCNINKCPLHPDYLKLFNSPEDFASKNKDKCIEKQVRMRIGKAFKLASQGLTSREIQGYKLLNLQNTGKTEKNANLSHSTDRQDTLK